MKIIFSGKLRQYYTKDYPKFSILYGHFFQKYKVYQEEKLRYYPTETEKLLYKL